jgi:hypothetical protein
MYGDCHVRLLDDRPANIGTAPRARVTLATWGPRGLGAWGPENLSKLDLREVAGLGNEAVPGIIIATYASDIPNQERSLITITITTNDDLMTLND